MKQAMMTVEEMIDSLYDLDLKILISRLQGRAKIVLAMSAVGYTSDEIAPFIGKTPSMVRKIRIRVEQDASRQVNARF